jgi:hypothetical protein
VHFLVRLPVMLWRAALLAQREPITAATRGDRAKAVGKLPGRPQAADGLWRQPHRLLRPEVAPAATRQKRLSPPP